MEATESLVAALLETQGYFVSTDCKIRALGEKTFGNQSHDIDVDIIAVNYKQKEILIGEVKSFWGSTGCTPDMVLGSWTKKRGPHSGLKIVNNKDEIQPKFEKLVYRQFGSDFEFHYVVFAGKVRNEEEIRQRLNRIILFGNPIQLKVIRKMLQEFIAKVRDKATKTTSYVNHPAVATILALEEYKMLKTGLEG